MAFDKTLFGGVVAPIVNPCGEDDSLDRAALALYCQAVGRLTELEEAFNGQVKRLMADQVKGS